MSEVQDQATKKEQKPLLPATPAGAAIVGIPIASILAFGGWTGEKLLDVDERLVRAEQKLDQRQETVDSVQRMEEHLAELGVSVDRMRERQAELIKSGISIDERLVRVETIAEDLKEEQKSLRERLRDLNINTRFHRARDQ